MNDRHFFLPSSIRRSDNYKNKAQILRPQTWNAFCDVTTWCYNTMTSSFCTLLDFEGVSKSLKNRMQAATSEQTLLDVCFAYFKRFCRISKMVFFKKSVFSKTASFDSALYQICNASCMLLNKIWETFLWFQYEVITKETLLFRRASIFAASFHVWLFKVLIRKPQFHENEVQSLCNCIHHGEEA